ncbi:MAG: endonuclease domain-containing protein [Actinomycetota bacterium]
MCLDCNAGLGAFEDDPHRLFEAVDYLHPVPWSEWTSK